MVQGQSHVEEEELTEFDSSSEFALFFIIIFFFFFFFFSHSHKRLGSRVSETRCRTALPGLRRHGLRQYLVSRLHNSPLRSLLLGALQGSPQVSLSQISTYKFGILFISICVCLCISWIVILIWYLGFWEKLKGNCSMFNCDRNA